MASCEKCKPWGIVCNRNAATPDGEVIEKPDGKGRFVAVETTRETVFLFTPSPIEECPVVTGQDQSETYAPVIKAGAAHIAHQIHAENN